VFIERWANSSTDFSPLSRPKFASSVVGMSHGEVDQSIYASATACSQLLDQYLASSTLAAEPQNHDVATELLGRFELWAAYVGAFAPPKVSLDCRLAGHPDVKEMVLELLAMVQRNLMQGWLLHRLLPTNAE
jgi:hypothetical protein